MNMRTVSDCALAYARASLSLDRGKAHHAGAVHVCQGVKLFQVWGEPASRAISRSSAASMQTVPSLAAPPSLYPVAAMTVPMAPATAWLACPRARSKRSR